VQIVSTVAENFGAAFAGFTHSADSAGGEALRAFHNAHLFESRRVER